MTVRAEVVPAMSPARGQASDLICYPNNRDPYYKKYMNTNNKLI